MRLHAEGMGTGMSPYSPPQCYKLRQGTPGELRGKAHRPRWLGSQVKKAEPTVQYRADPVVRRPNYMALIHAGAFRYIQCCLALSSPYWANLVT